MAAIEKQGDISPATAAEAVVAAALQLTEEDAAVEEPLRNKEVSNSTLCRRMSSGPQH